MSTASAFTELGLRPTIESLKEHVRRLYLEDTVPWVVGYSGGKDSTATLQLVWSALAGLPVEHRRKPVHVISTDTLVENPIVAAWVSRSLTVMNETARDLDMPMKAHRLTPDVKDTFWVNLIGKGYPAPRPKFRWCTERMKIKPSNAFIRGVVQENGEAILVLGIRKAESQARARVMARQETRRVRDQLSPNASLPNSLVFSPIEDWTNDDVWTFLMQEPNPWGYDNKDLLTMYQGASADGECPLVVDSSTPSCGDSRFGCWTCTLVDKDKSMHAMIQNDEEKEWMLPLLRLRDKLDVADDKPLRDFRRLNGTVQLFHDRPIHGPYTQAAREAWLRELLEAQRWIRENGPDDVDEIELISLAELEEIRRIWIIEKHEFEDRLPVIYEDTFVASYPGRDLDTNLPLGRDELELLEEICGDDRIHYEMVRELLDVERRHRAMVRRAGLFEHLERGLQRGFYTDKDDAIERARMRRDLLDAATAEPPGAADATTPIDPYLQNIEVVSSVDDPS
jgi:DNA sulfur modification protein DndC